MSIKNGDLPAMPITEAPIVAECAVAWTDRAMVGLTKREQFAMAALQGILSCDNTEFTNVAAISAVAHADALLAELENTK